MRETTKNTGNTKIWTGRVRLRDGRSRKPADEVNVKIILLSQSVVIEMHDGASWVPLDPFDVHPESLLRALGETGAEVA